MKIKLTCDIPVDQRHGLIKGKVLSTVPALKGKSSLPGVWVQGDGEKVRVLETEYECVAAEGEVDE